MPVQHGYVGVNVTRSTRQLLRSVVYDLAARTDRRITMSEAVLVACLVTGRHMDEAVELLLEIDDPLHHQEGDA